MHACRHMQYACMHKPCRACPTVFESIRYILAISHNYVIMPTTNEVHYTTCNSIYVRALPNAQGARSYQWRFSKPSCQLANKMALSRKMGFQTRSGLVTYGSVTNVRARSLLLSHTSKQAVLASSAGSFLVWRPAGPGRRRWRACSAPPPRAPWRRFARSVCGAYMNGATAKFGPDRRPVSGSALARQSRGYRQHRSCLDLMLWRTPGTQCRPVQPVCLSVCLSVCLTVS